MPSITEVVSSQRRALARREQATTRRVAAAHADVMVSLRRDLTQLTSQIDAARAAGIEPRASWLHRQTSYRLLLSQIQTEYGTLTRQAGLWIAGDVRWAARYGVEGGERLVRVGIGRGFNQFNPRAVEAIYAQTMSHLSPLQPILDQLAPGAADRAARILTDGVARGRGIDEVAQDLTRILGADVQRARLIARTEMMRAYRESTRATYREHGIKQWIWLSAANERTCASCWALHGRHYSTLHPMGTHPNCRCTMVPAIGDVTVEAGADLFAQQPAEVQRTVLGPAAHAAYSDGAIDLKDLVQVRRSPVWGTTRSRGSLVRALGPDRAADYYRP